MTAREQLEVGPLAAAAGGVLLLVSLFLDWYEPGISGWTVFEALDLLLAALGLAAIGALAVRLGVPLPSGDRGMLGGDAAPVIGGLAVAVVASQVFNHPPAAVDRSADIGQWLALGGAGLMLAGGALGFARLSVAVSFDQRRPPPSPSRARPARPTDSARSQGGPGGATRPAGSDDPTEQLRRRAVRPGKE